MISSLEGGNSLIKKEKNDKIVVFTYLCQLILGDLQSKTFNQNKNNNFLQKCITWKIYFRFSFDSLLIPDLPFIIPVFPHSYSFIFLSLSFFGFLPLFPQLFCTTYYNSTSHQHNEDDWTLSMYVSSQSGIDDCCVARRQQLSIPTYITNQCWMITYLGRALFAHSRAKLANLAISVLAFLSRSLKRTNVLIK